MDQKGFFYFRYIITISFILFVMNIPFSGCKDGNNSLKSLLVQNSDNQIPHDLPYNPLPHKGELREDDNFASVKEFDYFDLFSSPEAEQPSITPENINVSLKPGEFIEQDTTVYIPGTPPKCDIIFSFDLTKSMEGMINKAKMNSVQIMSGLRNLVSDTNFGVISHMDYIGQYEGCSYKSTYGLKEYGDYPYQLNQGITNRIDIVQSVINSLFLGYGGDGPENYSRVFYESYSDKNINWRSGSKKIMLAWLDSVPHDCNYGVCTDIPGTTGPDPGRDGIVGNSDDLKILEVLDAMAAHNITLIVLYRGNYTRYFDLWRCYAARTGGEAYMVNPDGSIPDGIDIVKFIQTLIQTEISHINRLTLKTSPGFENWLGTLNPSAYLNITLDTPKSFDFDVKIQVPKGTEPGIYTFQIYLDGDGATYAVQNVTINVETECINGVKVRIGPENFNVQDYNRWILGHLTPQPGSGYTYEDYRGGEIVSIGTIPVSIKGFQKYKSLIKFEAVEFAPIAGLIVPQNTRDFIEVPVCIVVNYSDGTRSCETCDIVRIKNIVYKK